MIGARQAAYLVRWMIEAVSVLLVVTLVSACREAPRADVAGATTPAAKTAEGLNAATTGPAALGNVELKPYAGPSVINEDGTVIEGRRILKPLE